MNKKIIGSIFILISTILYCTRYISAAISGANAKSWSKEEFIAHLSYVPSSLMTLSIIAMIIGLAYFITGLIDLKKQYNTTNKNVES